MHPLRTGLVLLMLASFISCRSKQKEAEAEFAGKSFTAIMPCADCEGIAYRLSFYANSKFESSSMYIGKSNEKFSKGGSWKLENDSTIKLMPSEGEHRQLRIKNDGLLWLDRSNKEIEGDLASRYVLRDAEEYPVEAKVQQNSGSSADFKAHGNEPFWGLEINFEKMMTFNVLDGDSLTTPVPEVEEDTVSGTRSYTAEAESGTLTVQLMPVGCMDSMSGLVYHYRVEVKMNEEEYSGCGGFTGKSYSIDF